MLKMSDLLYRSWNNFTIKMSKNLWESKLQCIIIYNILAQKQFHLCWKTSDFQKLNNLIKVRVNFFVKSSSCATNHAATVSCLSLYVRLNRPTAFVNASFNELTRRSCRLQMFRYLHPQTLKSITAHVQSCVWSSHC